MVTLSHIVVVVCSANFVATNNTNSIKVKSKLTANFKPEPTNVSHFEGGRTKSQSGCGWRGTVLSGLHSSFFSRSSRFHCQRQGGEHRLFTIRSVHLYWGICSVAALNLLNHYSIKNHFYQNLVLTDTGHEPVFN